MMRTAIINQSFRGYKVLRAVPDTVEKLNVLKGLVEDPVLDFWTLPANVMIPVDIMAPPENLDALEGTLVDNVSLRLPIRNIISFFEIPHTNGGLSCLFIVGGASSKQGKPLVVGYTRLFRFTYDD